MLYVYKYRYGNYKYFNIKYSRLHRNGLHQDEIMFIYLFIAQIKLLAHPL